jgi:hypothetical protein
MGVSLRFDQKLPVRGKNWSKLCISRSWPPYCESIIYNGPVFQFLRVWKFSHFCSKSKCVSQRFYRKLPVRGRNWPKLRISWSWPPYCESVIYNGPIFQFSRVLKILTFLLEIQKCYLTVCPKIASSGQKLIETPYFVVMTPVLRIGYL